MARDAGFDHLPMKNGPWRGPFMGCGGGGSGIRTRGGLLTPTRFPGVRLKPLIHPSAPGMARAPKGALTVLTRNRQPRGPAITRIASWPQF
jgi:hypothetical protein